MSITKNRRLFTGVALFAIVLLAAGFRFYRIFSLPPGDGYDPAWYGVDALDILAGDRPVFLPTNFGREVMFSYLVALIVKVVGVGPPAVHIAAALVGLATIPALYLVAKELFAEEEGSLRDYGALLAALTLAISYWHLVWSRFGVRAVLTPLFVSLTFYFLWRGFRRGRRWDYVWAGVFLGLSVYTYQAARIMPLAVMAGFAIIVFSRPRRRPTRADVVNLLIVGGLAFLIFLPLGYYFLSHPGSFSERINQTWAVTPEQGAGTALIVFAGRFVGLFDVLMRTGEGLVLHYLPGRAILDVFMSALLLAGLLIGLWRIKRPNYQFMFVWLVVMGIPNLLAQGRATKRAIGVLPVIILFIVVGALVPWDRVRRWAGERQSAASKIIKNLYLVALIVVFAGSGFLTFRDYFLVWGQDPDLFSHFEAGLTAVGRYASTLPEDEIVYVSPIPVDHPSVVFASRGRQGMRRYNGRACMVTPSQTTADITYIIVPGEANDHDPNSLDWLATFFPTGGIAAEGPLHYGTPYFRAYRVPAGSISAMAPAQSSDANWSDKIALIGYDLPEQVYRSGDVLTITLYFKALAAMDVDYTLSAQLLGPHNPATNGPLWAQYDSEPCQRFYPTSAWTRGELIREQISLNIPAETPAGSYELYLGFYRWPSLERLPLNTGDDAYLTTTIAIAPAP